MRDIGATMARYQSGLVAAIKEQFSRFDGALRFVSFAVCVGLKTWPAQLGAIRASQRTPFGLLNYLKR